MHGLREIKAANTPAKAKPDYRVQRDQLAKLVRNLIARIGDAGQELAIREVREFLDKM